MHRVLAFDLDGTLVLHAGDVRFEDAASLREGCIRNREAQKRVLRLLDQGHEVHVITGRGRVVRAVTLEQVHAISPEIQVHHQERFRDMTTMRDWKARKLRDIGADAFVGDHLMDEMAAEAAGVPFLHADAFAKGVRLLDLDDGHVVEVVPRHGVASPLRGPEVDGLQAVGAPRAAVRQVKRRAVQGVVDEKESVRHVPRTRKSGKKARAGGGR